MVTITAKNAPSAIGPYSHAIVSNGFVFTSGQLGVAPDTGELAGATIREQTSQAIKNLDAVLREANSGLAKVVKTLCFLKNMSDFAVFNEIYSKHFAHKPARSCVEISLLPKNALVEIEAVAEAG